MTKDFEYPPEIQQAFLAYVNKARQYIQIPRFDERILFSTGFDSDKYPLRMYHTYDNNYDPQKDSRNNPLYKIAGYFPQLSHVGFLRKGDGFEPAYIYMLGEVSWPNERSYTNHSPLGDSLSVNFVNGYQISCGFKIGGRKLSLGYTQDGLRLVSINFNGVGMNSEEAKAAGLVIPEQFSTEQFFDELFDPETLVDPINAPVELDKYLKFSDLIRASGVRLPYR